MSQQSEYKKIYVQESEELLQQMNQSLLILEKEPHNAEALHAIFRAAHTIKGMSASMGYAQTAELAHKMESVLDQLRSGTITANDKVVDLLFRSFDSLEAMVGAAGEDRQFSGDAASLMEALDKITIRVPKAAEEKTAEGISLNEFERRTLARASKQGYSCYRIAVTLDKDCVLKSVRAFMVIRNLHSIGETIKSVPSSQDLEEEKFDRGFECVFVSKSRKNAVKEKVLEILDVESAKVDEIDVSETWESQAPASSLIDTAAQPEPMAESVEHIRRIQSVRVDIARLDKMMNLVEELAISKLRLAEIGSRLSDASLKGITESFSRLTDELQNEVMQARLVPVSQVFERFPRLVRDLAKKEGKKVRFDAIGGDIELDRTVLDEIGDPLIHLLRNSIDHGIEGPEERRKSGKAEEGRVMLVARREKSHIFIEVEDDGAGMDVEKIKHHALKKGLVTEEALSSMTKDEILLMTANPGFSTRDEVTDLSGRGVGLDVARSITESLGGSIMIESEPGKGCKIVMSLPVTTAVVQALLTKVSGMVFAVPIASVEEIITAKTSDIKTIEKRETLLHRDSVLPVVRLENVFKGAGKGVEFKYADAERLNIVIVEFGQSRFGIVVDSLMSQQNIVIKQLTKDLKGVRGFAGATILGDGSVALVLDVGTLI